MAGCHQTAKLKFLHALEKNHPILTPTEANWLESGKLLSKLRLDTGFTPERLRRLHFDVLIALTGPVARSSPDHDQPCGLWIDLWISEI